MSEFTLEEFTRFVAKTLEDSGKNITLSNPDTSETFPVGVISAPMENIQLVDENNIPIKKTFSISIEWWTNTRYNSMELYNECTNTLRNNNFLMIGGIVTRYDDVTKKYICGAQYQVNYNGITNSFDRTK